MMYTRTARAVSNFVVAGVVVSVAVLSLPAHAQPGCPVTLTERSHWDVDTGEYGGLWADGNFAYQGQFGDSGVHFFDISDPDNIIHVLEWRVPAPNEFCSAQEVLAVNGLLFIALEANGGDGAEIVDIRDPHNPVHLTWIRTPNYPDVHNLVLDNGFLYVADSRTPNVGIIDMRTYDPDNPPATILTNKWLISVGSSFVHDISVQNGRMYVSAWDSGLHIYDITNVANVAPVFLGSAPGDSTHSAWATDDAQFVVTAEERQGGPLSLFEVTPNGPGVTVTFRDMFALPTNQSICAHEPFMVGDRVYTGWYQGGLLIHDLDRVQKRFVLRGQFDTFPGGAGGFDGAWGVYPFFGEDKLLVSDLSTGFWVIKTQPPMPSITYPQGVVTIAHPVDGATLHVDIDAACGNPDLNTARVIVNIDGSPTEIPLMMVGPGMFEADLPGAPCGSDYAYYITLDTLDGGTVVDPPGAPATQYHVSVQTSVEVFFTDTFQTDLGWTPSGVDCVSVPTDTGFWQAGDPIGTGLAPENDFPGDTGNRCYVTQQGLPGGGDSIADVDGGPFRLVSPVIAINNQDAEISYAVWVASNGDSLTVELSGDGGLSWLPAETVPSAGPQWVLHEIRVSDVMTPGISVRVRFSIQDCPNNSATEAAVDAFSVSIIHCADTVAPIIVHDAGLSTHPHSGYIDPRRESTNGVDFNEGLSSVSIAFSEPIRNIGGGALDASAFHVVSTGAFAPNIASVDAANNPHVVVTFDQPLRPGSWYTIIANVEDMAANAVTNNGDLGPGMDEPDRVDIGFLPGNIDQNNSVSPLDLLKFKQYVNGLAVPPAGVMTDYVDINRSGGLSPLDLLALKQLVNGISPPATQAWAGDTLDAARP